MADRLGAPWYAVYIQTPGEELERVDAATQRQIANTLALATQLGGVPMTFKGTDVVSTIAAFAAGVRHHAHRPGPIAAPVVSPLVRPIAAGSLAPSGAAGGRPGRRRGGECRLAFVDLS